MNQLMLLHRGMVPFFVALHFNLLTKAL